MSKLDLNLIKKLPKIKDKLADLADNLQRDYDAGNNRPDSTQNFQFSNLVKTDYDGDNDIFRARLARQESEHNGLLQSYRDLYNRNSLITILTVLSSVRNKLETSLDNLDESLNQLEIHETILRHIESPNDLTNQAMLKINIGTLPEKCLSVLNIKPKNIQELAELMQNPCYKLSEFRFFLEITANANSLRSRLRLQKSRVMLTRSLLSNLITPEVLEKIYKLD